MECVSTYTGPYCKFCHRPDNWRDAEGNRLRCRLDAERREYDRCYRENHQVSYYRDPPYEPMPKYREDP